MNLSIASSSSRSRIWPWPMTMRASGTSCWISPGHRLDGVDAVVHEEDLAVAVQLAEDRLADQLLVVAA